MEETKIERCKKGKTYSITRLTIPGYVEEVERLVWFRTIFIMNHDLSTCQHGTAENKPHANSSLRSVKCQITSNTYNYTYNYNYNYNYNYTIKKRLPPPSSLFLTRAPRSQSWRLSPLYPPSTVDITFSASLPKNLLCPVASSQSQLRHSGLEQHYAPLTYSSG